jgi:peptidoglycan biosynthesis protein MviN/MurJ (putative lipid II flippase)
MSGYRTLYGRILARILIIAAFLMIFFVLAGKFILGTLVGTGAFRSNNVSLLWLVMISLSGYFIGGLGGQITTSAYYARGDTRTPTILGIIFFIVFIPIKITSFYLWGVMGIAIATSIYYLTSLSAQIFYLQRNTYTS